MTFEEHLEKAMIDSQCDMPLHHKAFKEWQGKEYYYLWSFTEPWTKIATLHDGRDAYFVNWHSPDGEDETYYADMNMDCPPYVPIFVVKDENGEWKRMDEYDFDDDMYEFYLDGKLAEAEALIRLVNDGRPRIGYSRHNLRHHLEDYFYNQTHRRHKYTRDECGVWGFAGWCDSFDDVARRYAAGNLPEAGHEAEYIIERETWIPDWLAEPYTCYYHGHGEKKVKYIWEI